MSLWITLVFPVDNLWISGYPEGGLGTHPLGTLSGTRYQQEGTLGTLGKLLKIGHFEKRVPRGYPYRGQENGGGYRGTRPL